MCKKSVLVAAVLIVALTCGSAAATVIVFQGDLAGFNAAAGNPPVMIDFDSIVAGTNIAGTTIAGVTFSSPDGNSLPVVAAASTFTPSGFSGVIDATTNVLPATTSPNVLSPGGTELVPGPDPAQQDSLQLDFASPLSAFGIDLLLQSADFAPFTSFQVFDASSALVSSGSVTNPGGGPGGSPAGSRFIGFVSDDLATDFSRIVFIESDANAVFPDSNIGYDTLRFGREQKDVPEPSSSLLLLLGASTILVRRRR